MPGAAATANTSSRRRPLASACHAKGVAGRVSKHYPSEILADAVSVDLGSSRGLEPAYLGVDIGSAEIQVYPVLAGCGIFNLLKTESRPVRPDDRNEFARNQFLCLAFELLGPPVSQVRRVTAVERDHLHVKCHTGIVGQTGDKNARNAAA